MKMVDGGQRVVPRVENSVKETGVVEMELRYYVSWVIPYM